MVVIETFLPFSGSLHINPHFTKKNHILHFFTLTVAPDRCSVDFKGWFWIEHHCWNIFISLEMCRRCARLEPA